jgi:homoserine dehydrogenase
MRQIRIALIGYGGVGQAFAAALALRGPSIQANHGVAIEIVAVRRASLETGLRDKSGPIETWDWTPCTELAEFIAQARPDVVVQAVPSAPELAGVALDQAIRSLGGGAHFVTATKSALVTDWERLEEAALSASRAIRVSAAAGAALPAADVARRGVRGLGCIRIRGSLNGTSNAVLTQLAAGAPLAEAISTAVAAGIAEPEPVGDLSGADAAAKMVILANLVWGLALTRNSAVMEPITDSTSDRALAASAKGQALRAIATASAHEDHVRVSIDAVGPDDPLYRLTGAEKAVEFDCGLAGSVLVSGGRSSPLGAGLALLKDVINLATGDSAPGFR